MAQPSPARLTARRSSGHPVADNPIRLLAGSGWQTPRDLVKKARALKLMARDRTIEPVEPGQHLCPRLRTCEDYLAAEKQVTDATQFATAAAFAPDQWTDPATATGRANLLLLKAEQLAQGDGCKAELVNRAIKVWDSEAGLETIQAKCAEARQFFGSAVDATEVQRRVGQALCAVAEQVIADFGDSIEASEIDLLNTLDACQRLPETRGAAAAGDAVILKQHQRIDRYLNEAIAVINRTQFADDGSISESEIQRLVAGCKEARQAFALLKRRPALFRKLPEDRLMHVSTVSIALAYRLGWSSGKWAAAAELAAGVSPEHIDQSLEPRTHRLFLVSCQAIPLMARVAQGNDVTEEIAALNRRHPDCVWEVSAFLECARAMLKGEPRPGWPKPEDDSAATKGVGTLLGVVVGLLLAFARCSSSDNRSGSDYRHYQPSYVPPPNPSRSYDPLRPHRSIAPPAPQPDQDFSSSAPLPPRLTETSTLDATGLAVRMRRVLTLVQEMRRVGRELDNERRRVDTNSATAVRAFNAKVRLYQQLAERATEEQDAYNAAARDYNQSWRTNGP